MSLAQNINTPRHSQFYLKCNVLLTYLPYRSLGKSP